MCGCHMSVGACGKQKRALDPLKLSYIGQMGVSHLMWEPNLSHLQEQYMLVTAEPFFSNSLTFIGLFVFGRLTR